MMTKSMTGTFKDLNANRRAAAEARCRWGVFSLTKKGTVSKTPSLKVVSEADAIEGVDRMEKLNPGKTFVAREL